MAKNIPCFIGRVLSEETITGRQRNTKKPCDLESYPFSVICSPFVNKNGNPSYYTVAFECTWGGGSTTQRYTVSRLGTARDAIVDLHDRFVRWRRVNGDSSGEVFCQSIIYSQRDHDGGEA